MTIVRKETIVVLKHINHWQTTFSYVNYFVDKILHRWKYVKDYNGNEMVMLQDKCTWIKNILVKRGTCRTDLLLTLSEMLLTLTGTRFVDWGAFLVLVIASATASGAGEYKIIYDAGKTGCRRLYIHILN